MKRVAVVGTGLIATLKHLPAWQSVGSAASLVALCDVNRENAQKAASRFGIPAVYDSLAELLERERPDIVDICTPPKTHAPLALQALEGGAHVLLEKPMALSVEECDRIIEAGERAGRQICVAHSDLFYPSFIRARQLVQEGRIGKLRGMRIFLSTPTDYITSKADHWANKLPGGVIGETGPHVVYMTLAFIDPIRDVQVQGQKQLRQYPWSPFEDYRITLAGAEATSSITLTYASRHWAAEVEVWGEDGLLRFDLESQALIHYRRDSLTLGEVARSTLGQAAQIVGGAARTGLSVLMRRHLSTHDLIIRGFCRSIEEGTVPPVPASQGRESIRVMDLLAARLEQQTV